MVQVISFPGLGIGEIALNRVAFTLFGLPIYWYGVIIALGFLLGISYIVKRAPKFGVDSDKAMDVLLGACIGGIVGARLYYVIFSGQQMFSEYGMGALPFMAVSLAVFLRHGLCAAGARFHSCLWQMPRQEALF